MTRPNTRSKNKRPRTEDSDLSAETLRKIHFTGEITESDIRQLYSISKPICQGCRGNSKDSPNCFCGLIPPPNGSRKTGLWQRMPDIIRSLGPDPNKDIRTSTETPAGLTNLGATCYANSILQCLYMTTSFRNRIFSLEHELLKHRPVLDQLARLFAQLHSSKMAFIDSAPFIKTLDLDNGVQQDSHEFLTLFLSLLERSLCHSKVANAKTAVQDLFRGNVSHVTRCSVCGNDSEASSKMEDFYELELNIKGLNNLDESLDDYLNVEELSGENQYFCYSCDERVDATRSIKLRALPEVLNFQLRRYAFLSETTTRKKITSAFSFPRWLNMGRRLSNPCDSGLIYELFAILIHKGTAVNSGHYVAHIKDEKSGQWWEFDDEHVSKLGCHPFGEASSKSSAKSQPKGQLVGSDTKESDLNGDHVFPSKMKDEVFSSTDAYMLMYILRKENYNDRSSSSSKNNSLPLHLDEEIQEFNSTIDSACMAYQQKKDKNVDYITERRTEVKSILSEAPVDPNENSFFWISTEWLRLWADSITSSSIDNSPIQCLHGKAPISKVTSMKRLSNTAWKILLSKYGGGPTLSSDNICIDCIKDEAKNAVCAGDFRDRKASFRQLAEAALAGNCAGAPAYYVSRTWLTQWLRKKDSNCSSDNDTGPTTSLQCSHGNLLPEQASGAKRVLVPEELWLFFREASNSLETSDQMGFLPFHSSSESCGLCNKELNEVASLEDSLRATKLKQRQNHEKLFARKSVALDPGCKYFLVPSSWLGKWRAYVTTTGKNVFSSAEPENLEGTIGSLICRKHSRLLERPCELIHKHGCITQKITTADGLILILENDWVLFCEEWSVKNVKGIQAEIVVEDLGHSTVNASDASVPSKFFIKTVPEVCEDCIRDRESCEFIRKLNYTDQDIRVNLVRGKKAPKSIMDSSGSVSELDRRTSKRSRKTSFGKSVKLTVSGSTSIYDLKMMIWEAFGVVRENQKLSKGLMDIEGDSATLADMNIFPGDVLLVTDTKIFENRDIADDLLMNSEPSQTEEGFRGTLLSSDLSVHISQDT